MPRKGKNTGKGDKPALTIVPPADQPAETAPNPSEAKTRRRSPSTAEGGSIRAGHVQEGDEPDRRIPGGI